ncbi:MAG: AzlC family ABC transporter permease [Eubacteriales bacterium]|jgi:4-azaleucine resistance transporter AzlC
MKEFKAAFPKTFPVMAGYIFLGITYGILMVTNGFPIWLPIVTATVVYTGSMEFLLVEILQSAFNPVSALVTSLMVGARHIFYGIAMLSKYKGSGKAKPYLIYALTDETFAVNYSAEIPEDCDKTRYYLIVSALDQCYWIAGSALGALFGSLITFNTRGLDFIMTTMFVSIFMNQWVTDSDNLKKRVEAAGRKITWKDSLCAHGSELIGVAGSVICLLIFGPDHFIVPSMILVLVALTLFRKQLDPELMENVSEGSDRS